MSTNEIDLEENGNCDLTYVHNWYHSWASCPFSKHALSKSIWTHFIYTSIFIVPANHKRLKQDSQFHLKCKNSNKCLNRLERNPKSSVVDETNMKRLNVKQLLPGNQDAICEKWKWICEGKSTALPRYLHMLQGGTEQSLQYSEGQIWPQLPKLMENYLQLFTVLNHTFIRRVNEHFFSWEGVLWFLGWMQFYHLQSVSRWGGRW